jgi:hypothetical protein
MNGVAKPTTVSKDRFLAAEHQHFRLDSHAQRGCAPFRRASRGLREALPPRISGPDFSRQTSAEPVAIPFQ